MNKEQKTNNDIESEKEIDKNQDESNSLDLLDNFYNDLSKSLTTRENKSAYAKYFFKLIKRGNKEYYHKNITETKIFDEIWIKTLESYFPSIDRIISNPKTTIRYDQEVVAVEKAKKIDSSSVRHLASHTHLIKEVNASGVIPKKILTTFAEDDLGTYENRFVMTLITRLALFVNNRAIIIKDNVESYQKEHLNYVNNYEIKGTNVSLNVDLVIKKDLEDKGINVHNHELLAKVERLQMLINGYKNSPFMQALSKAKKVASPIMKTNVILKNVDFKNAYTLWLFLDRYNGITYDSDIQERLVPMNEEYIKDLERVSLLTYTMLQESIEKRAETFIDLNDVPKTRLKSTKVIKTNPADILKNPDGIQIVDNTINEYYLETFKKLISKKIKDYIAEDLKEEAALKKAVEDLVCITNTLLNELFKFEETEEEFDYFNQMAKLSDPFKDLKTAKEKANLIKVVRIAKENDYKETIKLEKKILKEMEKAQTTIIKADRDRKRMDQRKTIQKKIDADTKRNKLAREKVREEIKLLDGKILDTQTNKTRLQQERDDMKERVKNYAEAYKASDAITLQAELDLLEAEHQKEMDRLWEENKQKLAEAKERYNKRLSEIKEEEKRLKEEEKQKQKELHNKAVKEKIEKLRNIEKIHKRNLDYKVSKIDKETDALESSYKEEE